MSEEIKFEYLLNGVPVQKEDINFDQSLEIRVVDNKVKVTTLSKKEENGKKD